jgi:hypothetical protein
LGNRVKLRTEKLDPQSFGHPNGTHAKRVRRWSVGGIADWLTQRGVHLQESENGLSWLVYLDKERQYLLMAVPAKSRSMPQCNRAVTIHAHG